MLMAGGFEALGQFAAPGGLPPGFHHALLDVLAGQPPFFAQASIQLSNGSDQPATSISCNIAYSQGRLHLDVDSFIGGTNMPSDEAAKLRNMRSSMIVRPDRNRTYLLFPQFKSCVEMAYSKKSGSDPSPAPVIGKVPLGKEVAAGQPCEKSQWSITELSGEHYDVTVWTSTNLDNFPVQVQIGPPSALVVFQDLRFVEPDGSLFEPPAGYMRYDGIPELIHKDVQRLGGTNVP